MATTQLVYIFSLLGLLQYRHLRKTVINGLEPKAPIFPL